MDNDLTLSPAASSPGLASSRSGVAMVTALLGIVVLAILIGGASKTANQEFRSTRNALIEQRAFAVSEFGLNSEISNWDRSRNLPGGMAIGEIDSNQVYVAVGDTAWVKVTRLTDNSFFVLSDGQANIGNNMLASRRRTSAFVRIAYPTISPNGAITAAGDVTVSGAARVSGYDTDPAWTQCAAIPNDTVAAVAVPPGELVKYGPLNILSTPEVLYDPAAADSNTYVRFGSESWNSLAANADVRLTNGNFTIGSDILPVGTATTCDTSLPMNWGEPDRPGVVGCYGYYPIIYIDDDLEINSKGRGQGILLVNGDIRINGDFTFYGVVIAREDIEKGNGTAQIFGAVFAANSTLGDPSTFVGTQDVFYSRCAIESALRGSAILTAVKERGWAQIF